MIRANASRADGGDSKADSSLSEEQHQFVDDLLCRMKRVRSLDSQKAATVRSLLAHYVEDVMARQAKGKLDNQRATLHGHENDLPSDDDQLDVDSIEVFVDTQEAEREFLSAKGYNASSSSCLPASLYVHGQPCDKEGLQHDLDDIFDQLEYSETFRYSNQVSPPFVVGLKNMFSLIACFSF